MGLLGTLLATPVRILNVPARLVEKLVDPDSKRDDRSNRWNNWRRPLKKWMRSDPMTAAQEALAKDYGTPEQFAESVWEAHGRMMVTSSEAVKAISQYKREWAAAGQQEEACKS